MRIYVASIWVRHASMAYSISSYDTAITLTAMLPFHLSAAAVSEIFYRY